MDTTILECDFKPRWGAGQRDAVILTHGVAMRGNRYYLISRNVQHHSFPLRKGIQRVENCFQMVYFEPTADGKGVKATSIGMVNLNEDGYTDTLQSIANLQHLLRQSKG